MIGLLAQCMFEATRISPQNTKTPAKDWRALSRLDQQSNGDEKEPENAAQQHQQSYNPNRYS